VISGGPPCFGVFASNPKTCFAVLQS